MITTKRRQLEKLFDNVRNHLFLVQLLSLLIELIITFIIVRSLSHERIVFVCDVAQEGVEVCYRYAGNVYPLVE